MLELSLNVSERSSFLRSRRTVSIEAELTDQAAGIPVSDFLEQLFRSHPNFIPEEAFRAGDESAFRLENIRGRPSEAFPTDENGEASDLRRKQREELFFTRGVVLEPVEDEIEGTESSEFVESPFSFRITTRFETFRETSNVVYRVFHTPSPVLEEIKPVLSGRLLARLLPFRLDTIRLGLESYRTRTFGSLFGSVPAVQDRLYLEITRSKILLTASGDFPRKDEGLPFSKDNLLGHVDAALRSCQLFPNLSQEIRARLHPV